jgi:hypothetical protein
MINIFVSTEILARNLRISESAQDIKLFWRGFYLFIFLFNYLFIYSILTVSFIHIICGFTDQVVISTGGHWDCKHFSESKLEYDWANEFLC